MAGGPSANGEPLRTSSWSSTTENHEDGGPTIQVTCGGCITAAPLMLEVYPADEPNQRHFTPARRDSPLHVTGFRPPSLTSCRYRAAEPPRSAQPLCERRRLGPESAT